MIYCHHMIFKLNYKTCVLVEIKLVNIVYVWSIQCCMHVYILNLNFNIKVYIEMKIKR